MKRSSSIIFLLLLLVSCGKETDKTTTAQRTPAAVDVPEFNADSAYSFVKQQVDFGPRIPGTVAHRQTAEFLASKLKKYGGAVTLQEFESPTWDGQTYRLTNIIASFNPEIQKRILLAAHWDTRPVADKDPEEPQATFDGANDGASGVGVLLEIARLMGLEGDSNAPRVGIDIIFFDGEDWGEPETRQVALPEDLDSWWCLGSQYWASHKHNPGYSAYYGILLDMVGGKDARFYREGLSLLYAPSVVEKIWNTAEKLGYSHYFVKQNQGEVTDDHKFVTEIGKIPMVDVVTYDPAHHSFGSFHHTRADNMSLIDRETLKAVGSTVLHVIYSESSPGLATR